MCRGLAALAAIATLAARGGAQIAPAPGVATVLDQRQLDARGIETIGDLQFQLPSVVADGGSELSLRGVGTLVIPGGRPAVAIAQDGVTAARAAPLAPLYDLEDVEIVRGPVGPAHGRAVGGAANLTTRRPQDTFAAGLDYEVAARSVSRLRATLNAPVAGDRAAARLAVLYTEERGDYGLQSGDGRDAADEDLLSVRSSLRYRIADDLLADASWTFTRQDPSVLTLAGASARPPSLQSHFATVGLTWRRGDFVVESRNGYQSAESAQRLGTLDASDDVRVWSSRLTLSFDDGGPFKVRMGLGYFDEANEGAGATGVAATDGSPTAPREFSLTARTRAQTTDGFTEVSYALRPGWRAHAGFRLAYDERELDDRSRAANAPPDAALPVRRGDETSVTWRCGSDVDVGETTLIYASVGTAERPAGFDFAGVAFEDEELLGVQAGAENRWLDDQLAVDLAGFFYDYDDVQTLLAVPGRPSARAVNLPAAESFGVELESIAAPRGRFAGLVIDGAAGWLHTRVAGGTVHGTNVALGGAELPLSPQLSAHVGAQYTFDVARIAPGELTARADYTYRDRMYFDAGNRLAARAWDFADLRLIYERDPETGGARVEVFVENLWDERAALALLPPRAGANALLALNEPRTYGVRVSTTFR